MVDSWQQTYSLWGQGLAFSAVLAAIPIFVLLFLLGVLRKPAWVAGLSGLAAALLLAIFGYGMPVKPAVSAAVYGGAFGLFPISWIIFWAIALFRVTVKTGKFEIIRDSIGYLTPDPRLQAILVAFCFGAFLEGGAGFGTPVAVAATMLTGLGFSPFSASAICLLANTAPVAFGSIGIPVITLAGTTGLPLDKLSGAVGYMCSPISLIIPVYLVVALAGFKAMSKVWTPAIVGGVVFAIVQAVVSGLMGPQLSAILAAVASMLALILVVRLGKSKAELAQIPGTDLRTVGLNPAETPAQPQAVEVPKHALGEVLYAWLPYGLLVTCVIVWGFAPVQKFLNKGTIAFGWPWLHDVALKMPPVSNVPTPYHALFSFNFFSAAGTACMVATFLSAICLGVGPMRFVKILGEVTRQMALPILTVVLVLGIGFLMNYCGATTTLGLAFASTGKAFPFFSPLIGLLGVFLTGSDTSSNALFGNLQVVTATRLGLDPVLMAGANAAGGVMGKMISLQTIAVAAAATGLSVVDQSKLFRFTIKHAIFLAFLVGCLALFYSYVLYL